MNEMMETRLDALPDDLGFRSGVRGTHTSRTMMLTELTTTLAAVPGTASLTEYREAVINENVLAKKTASNRRLTAQRLAELYGLDASIALFRHLRFFWDHDGHGRLLLASLCANARDPLLRMTASRVLSVRIGEVVTSSDLDDILEASAPGRFNPSTRNKIARNALSSWTQAGHLEGRRVKKRRHPVVTPANTAYALLLGHLSGHRGPMLFDTFWTGLLDAQREELHTMATEASRREWLDYRRLGRVVEVKFNGLLTQREKDALHG